MHGLKPEWSMSMSVPCTQWLLLPYHRQGQREGQVPKCWNSSPKGLVLAGSFPFEIMVSTLLSIAPSPQRGAALEQKGPALSPIVGQGAHWQSWHASQSLRQFLTHHLCQCLQWPSLLFHDSLPGVSKLFPTTTLPTTGTFALIGISIGNWSYGAWNRSPAIWACTEVSQETGLSPEGFILLPPTCSREQSSMCILFRRAFQVSYSPPISPTGFQAN